MTDELTAQCEESGQSPESEIRWSTILAASLAGQVMLVLAGYSLEFSVFVAGMAFLFATLGRCAALAAAQEAP